jgi:hypothetical protein
MLSSDSLARLLVAMKREAYHLQRDQAGNHQSAVAVLAQGSDLVDLAGQGVVACPEAAEAPVEEERALAHLVQHFQP